MPLRILNLFIKSFFNCFFDITLTLFDNSFNSFFSNFIFSLTNFCVIGSIFSFLLFLFSFPFCVTKLLILRFLHLTAVRAVVVAKLIILGISPLTSFVLALKEALVPKLIILGISPVTSFILALTEALVTTLVLSGILSSTFFILA